MSTPAEKYLTVPQLVIALWEQGITVTEPFLHALLATGAPHIRKYHHALAQASKVLAWCPSVDDSGLGAGWGCDGGAVMIAITIVGWG